MATNYSWYQDCIGCINGFSRSSANHFPLEKNAFFTVAPQPYISYYFLALQHTLTYNWQCAIVPVCQFPILFFPVMVQILEDLLSPERPPTKVSTKQIDSVIFALHFTILRSSIVTKKSHLPSKRIKPEYAEKKKALVNHFGALIWVRNPSHFICLLIIGTMAVWKKACTWSITTI